MATIDNMQNALNGNEKVPIDIASVAAELHDRLHKSKNRQPLCEPLTISIDTARANPTETSRKIVLDLLSMDADTEWKTIGKPKNGVQLYTHLASPETGNVTVFKGVSIVHQPVAVVAAFVGNTSFRHTYDLMFDQGIEIEAIAPAIGVQHWIFKTPTFVKQRDACVLMTGVLIGEKAETWIGAGSSIEHPDCAPSKKYVRAIIPRGGYIVRPFGVDKSLVTYIGSVDVGGSLPRTLLDILNSRQPLGIASIDEELRKNIPFSKSEVEERWQKYTVMRDIEE